MIIVLSVCLHVSVCLLISLFVSMHCLFLSLCQSVYLIYSCLSVCLHKVRLWIAASFIYPSVCLFVLFIYLLYFYPACLHVPVSVICLSVSVYLYIYLSTCLSVCPSAFAFISVSFSICLLVRHSVGSSLHHIVLSECTFVSSFPSVSSRLLVCAMARLCFKVRDPRAS